MPLHIANHNLQTLLKVSSYSFICNLDLFILYVVINSSFYRMFISSMSSFFHMLMHDCLVFNCCIDGVVKFGALCLICMHLSLLSVVLEL